MKLSEMLAKKSGIPEGFQGQKAKWDEIGDPFQIEKVAILQRAAVGEDGQAITYTRGSKAGQTVMDRTAVLQIITSEAKFLVRTNSRRITSLFVGQIEGRDADGVNNFGDQIFIVQPPEGWVRFVPYKQKYSNGKEGNVADLAEAE